MSENLPDIFTGITRPDLFEKFKLQLKKDFETCALPGEFADKLEPDFNSIIQVLTDQLSVLNKNSFNRMSELLYRIDVSEQQIKKAGDLYPEKDLIGIIAELIIKRILQKVVYKEYFKQ